LILNIAYQESVKFYLIYYHSRRHCHIGY